jgi:hypothetical protein
MKATVGFPGLPVTEGFTQIGFESPGFAPAPTSVETLRHIADTISGDGAFIMQGILRKAADELEAANVRIAALEQRAAQAAELVSKAVKMMAPPKI